MTMFFIAAFYQVRRSSPEKIRCGAWQARVTRLSGVPWHFADGA
ncbi:hypothetical protein [Ralstonia mannitolilytica]|nr:hypothetical protein [Ralstonia mannitolilytica]